MRDEGEFVKSPIDSSFYEDSLRFLVYNTERGGGGGGDEPTIFLHSGVHH